MSMRVYDDDVHFSNSEVVLGLKLALMDLMKGGAVEGFERAPVLPVKFVAFLIPVMKAMPDKVIYFPKGKWATIQEMERAVDDWIKVSVWANVTPP